MNMIISFVLWVMVFIAIVSYCSYKFNQFANSAKPKHGTAIRSEMGKSKFQLITEEGTYEADSLIKLLLTVIQHRTWHFFNRRD